MPPDSAPEPEMINQAYRKRDVKALLELLEQLEPKFKYTPVFVHIRVTRLILEGIQKASKTQESENAEELKNSWAQLSQKIFDLHLAISRLT